MNYNLYLFWYFAAVVFSSNLAVYFNISFLKSYLFALKLVKMYPVVI